ncbi:MAG TPA: glycosyltransferase family 39 protein [Patescibacteria group bacterium]|nr:glycosyltransferase family 39 protein [Patescibacteria group bacterium]
MKNLYLFFVIATFCVAFFLRFYHFSDLPMGLNQDETAIGYNASLILQTGRDEYGHFLPLYFKSFGDYKLPVYIYLTSFSEKLFGFTAFAVRFWSALLGSCTIVIAFFLVAYIARNKWLSFTTAALLTVNPWQLFFSRIALEVNIANFFLTLGVLLFLMGIDKKKLLLLTLSLLSFGLSLYSYNVARFVAPVMLCFLISLKWKEIHNTPLFWKVFSVVLFFIILSPFVMTLFSSSGFTMQKNVLIFGGQSQANILMFRSYLVSLPNLITKLFFNNIVLWVWVYLGNLIGFFSPGFFFLQGSTFSVSVGNVGMFYPFEAIAIAAGCFLAFTDKRLRVFTGWFLIVLCIVSLSAETPHATRDFVAIIPLTVFSAAGLLCIFSWIQKQPTVIRNMLFTVCFLLIGYSLVYFAASYTQQFPALSAQTYRAEDKPLALFLKSREGTYQHIVIATDADFIYTSLLFYQQYPAKNFLATARHEPDSLFIHLQQVGKYAFAPIDWSKVSTMKRTLLVVKGTATAPSNIHLLATFPYPQRHIVLPLSTMYAQYPVTDIAYKVYETK